MQAVIKRTARAFRDEVIQKNFVRTLVGKDKYNNEYYENNSLIFARNRAVKIAPENKEKQIDIVWLNWLYKADVEPQKALKPRPAIATSDDWIKHHWQDRLFDPTLVDDYLEDKDYNAIDFSDVSR